MKLKTFWIFVGLMIAVSSFSSAQILITPQIPPQGVLLKNQLWNLVVINNSGSTQEVQLQLTITDAVSGQTLISAATRTIVLPKGGTLLKEKDLAPIRYTFGGSVNSVAGGTSDFLPVGNYTVCYVITENHSKGFDFAAGEECVDITVEPMTPPQLISPADTSVLDTRYPYFNWIPPAPLSMFNNLSYEILIVELRKGQSPYEAMERNSPLFIERYLNTPYLLYPASYKALEPGRDYAWQVIAKNGNTYAQKTEVWSFTIKKDTVTNANPNGTYVKLRKGFDANSYPTDGDLYVEYNNESGDTLVHVSIYLLNNNQRQTMEIKKIKLKQGQNFIHLKLSGQRRYRHNQEYILELKNGRNELWNMKLRYIIEEQ